MHHWQFGCMEGQRGSMLSRSCRAPAHSPHPAALRQSNHRTGLPASNRLSRYHSTTCPRGRSVGGGETFSITITEHPSHLSEPTSLKQQSARTRAPNSFLSCPLASLESDVARLLRRCLTESESARITSPFVFFLLKPFLGSIHRVP